MHRFLLKKRRAKEIDSVEELVKRINELARKSKAEGLTETEKAEQQELRRKYIDIFKKNVKTQIEGLTFERPDGSTFTAKDIKKK